jgi:hypothetical protein
MRFKVVTKSGYHVPYRYYVYVKKGLFWKFIDWHTELLFAERAIEEYKVNKLEIGKVRYYD